MNSFIRRAATAVGFAFGLAATLSHGTVDQPGTLDPFWATGSPLGAGKVMTPVGTGADIASALALQLDGKLVLSGYCFGTTYDFCAVRYNANGTLDTSFGSGGKIITPIGTSFDTATALALQTDGKIVVAGYCFTGTNIDFCALRYNTDGTLDPSFGSGGTVITAVGTGDDEATGVAMQPDGKLVLSGYCTGATNFDFCVLRYNANGTPDASFGSGGKVITPIGVNDDRASALALQPDGKLVLAGYCSNGTNNDFCALRYNANGTLDAGFGTGGKVTTPVGATGDQALALALQPDGRIVLAGYCTNGGNTDFCALRYNANGTLDATFGTAGKVITPLGAGNDTATAVATQSDGKLVLAGYCSNGSNSDFCALRYNTNGTLDTSFGSSGKVITPVATGDDNAYAVTLQPDGKLVLAGYCFDGTNFDFCAIRYDGGPFGYKNCSLDIDGDNRVLATTDSLIHARIALGITGSAVTNGITFPPTATRNTWPLIRDYLVTQCGMSLPQ